MDWGNVTVEELIVALREVEWSSPPRPLADFFGKFTFPRTLAKWNSRLKCNFYYYRTNYFTLILLVLVIPFLRNPLALLAVLLSALSVACLNDSFAFSLSQKLTRMIRRVSPHLAAKMRPPITPVIRGRPGPRKQVHICGQRRNLVVLGMSTVAVSLWFVLSAFLIVIGALVMGLTCTILHASFRTPNLKARLNTYREEFRAVWRSYSDI